MIRIFGMMIISLSVLGFGFIYITSARDEYRRLLSIRRLADLIRTRIECFNQPLPQIYKDFSDKALDDCGFTEELRKNGFSFALMKCKDRLEMRGELIKLLSDFGSELGKTPAEEQVRHISCYIDIFDKKLSLIEGELPKRIKTAGCVSAALALMTFIVLI